MGLPIETSTSLPTRPYRLGTIGDSQGASDYSEATPGAPQLGNTYIDTGIALTGRHSHAKNACVGGEASGTVLNRFYRDALRHQLDGVVITVGANNLTDGVGDAGIGALARDVESMVVMAKRSGVLPILVTPLPKGTNAAANTVRSDTDEVVRAQPFFYAIAQHHQVPLFDAFRYVCNPANGSWASTTYSTDGTHPLAAAVAILAPLFADFLKALPPCGPYFAASAQAAMGDIANLMANGTFVNGGGGFGFWTLTTSADSTRTQEDPPAGGFWTGKTMKVVREAGGQAVIATGSAISGWTAGDEIEFNGRLKVSGLTPGTSTGVTLSVLASTGTVWQARPLKTKSFNAEYVFSLPFTVPAGSGPVSIQLVVNDIGTYEANNFTLLNRTRMRAIYNPGSI
ncbi:MAG: SGNH/GDSL hydrolase family protein [Lautropia sp.]